ncbi:MAG: hypothetical protein HHAS10_06220 [Candidatus Altimarinota bacterium]
MTNASLPKNTKWSGIGPRFRLPLEKVSEAEWAGMQEERKREALRESVVYITSHIPGKILGVLMHRFTLQAESLETGETIETPGFIGGKGEIRVGMYWGITGKTATQEAAALLDDFRINHQADYVRSVLLRFSQYIKGLLSMDDIDIHSDFFELLPHETKKKILIHKLKRRLEDAGGKYSIDDVDTFLSKYAKSLDGLILLDPLLSLYWENVLNSHRGRSFGLNREQIETLKLLMGQEQTGAMIREVMPILSREGETNRTTITLEPIAAEAREIASEGFSFHLHQGNQVEQSEKGFHAVAAYYNGPLQDVLRELGIKTPTTVRLERLEEGRSLIEGKLWGVVPSTTIISTDPSQVTILRMAFTLGRKLRPEEKEMFYNLVRKSFPATNTYLSQTSGSPQSITKGFMKGGKRDTTEGIFGEEGFLDNSAAFVTQDDQETLFLHISNFNIDIALYLSLQLESIVNTGQPIPSEDAWTQVIIAYNNQLVGKNDVFDISKTSQYRAFIQSVVVPHSSHGKTRRHTLLCGMPGSGKSQYTFNLLTRRSYPLGTHEIELTALVVPITIGQLSEMTTSDASSVSQRIENIHRKTGRHILLVVEDIDSLAGEDKKEEGKNTASQGLTNLLDGIGKTSYITIVATSNYPYTLPGRLVRKGRFDNVLEFEGFHHIDEVKDALSVYLEKYSIKPPLHDPILSFSERMIGFTWSMIADFVQRIHEELDFRALLGQEQTLTPTELNTIFENLHVSRHDFEGQIHSTREWLKSVKNAPEPPLEKSIL